MTDRPRGGTEPGRAGPIRTGGARSLCHSREGIRTYGPIGPARSGSSLARTTVLHPLLLRPFHRLAAVWDDGEDGIEAASGEDVADHSLDPGEDEPPPRLLHGSVGTEEHRDGRRIEDVHPG